MHNTESSDKFPGNVYVNDLEVVLYTSFPLHFRTPKDLLTEKQDSLIFLVGISEGAQWQWNCWKSGAESRALEQTERCWINSLYKPENINASPAPQQHVFVGIDNGLKKTV